MQVTMARDEKGKPKGMEFKTFRLKTTMDVQGIEERFLEFHTDKLRSFLRDNISIEDIYDDVPVIPVYTLFNQLDQIKHRAKRYDMLAVVKELISFLEEENKGILGRINNMLERGQMSFGLCKTLFSEGTEIEIHGDEVMGGRVVNTEYRASMFGTYLQIIYEYVGTDGRSYMQRRDNVRINAFSGVKEITKLPIRPMTPETKARLTERGKIFARVAIGAHYMQYQGMMGVKKWWNWDSMRAEGRMMVDPGTYAQFIDEYDRDDDDHAIDELSTDALWMTDPYVKGFSFVTKQWGRFAVGNISSIAFRSDAFDQLVLAEDKKELVRALVTYGGGGFQDIISGKGGGCIFLLHGDPGVGKTLTAEAIAELLHRPLYSVAVGELGTNTEQLEKSLRQILDVAQIWNAVVLIDEADIFLEKRTSGDILRNAMVGIFLRLLEYHQGVLFLTTNRVTEFDSAFHSRISVALKYGALTREAREKIWTNLLAAARIEGLDPAELSLTEINGRQIKNTIRLAQGLAAQQGVTVTAKHIEMTLAVSQQFQRDLKEG
jgi:hypothetical protein